MSLRWTQSKHLLARHKTRCLRRHLVMSPAVVVLGALQLVLNENAVELIAQPFLPNEAAVRVRVATFYSTYGLGFEPWRGTKCKR